jgi:uncharacterized membrane protein YeaQ/YmgE (transglycosylase-associated protein family)
MKKVGVFASMIFGLVGAACATAASADDIMVTKAGARRDREVGV